MADKVIYQDGDDLSETNLALMLAVGNQTDYKERGFGFDADWTNNDLTIGTTDQWGNFAIIEDAKQAYYLLADQRTVSLPNTNGKNYVYLHHDPTQDDHIGIHVDSNQTPPTNPSLLIGTVDTSNQTYDDTINDSPDGKFGALGTEKQVISPSEWAVDGTISVSATQSTTYNLNNNYDWVIVDVDEIKNQSGDSQDLQIRLNGDSGSNYTEKDDTGAGSNTQTEWGLVEGIADNKTYAGPLWFDGQYSDFVTMRAWGSPSDFGATFNPNARNFNVGTPLNSIEIRGSAGDIDVEATVRGRVVK
jgi:hypothetical protein